MNIECINIYGNWQQIKILHKAYLKAICSKTENIFGVCYMLKKIFSCKGKFEKASFTKQYEFS